MGSASVGYVVGHGETCRDGGSWLRASRRARLAAGPVRLGLTAARSGSSVRWRCASWLAGQSRLNQCTRLEVNSRRWNTTSHFKTFRSVPRPGRDLGQGVVVLEVLDEEFHRGALVVEPPDVAGPKPEIGDVDMVGPVVQLEQGQLVLRRVGLGQQLADRHEAVRLLPVLRLITEARDLQAGADPPVPSPGSRYWMG